MTTTQDTVWMKAFEAYATKNGYTIDQVITDYCYPKCRLDRMLRKGVNKLMEEMA